MQNYTESRVISGLLSVITSTEEYFLGSIPTDKNLSVHILIGDLSVPSVLWKLMIWASVSSKSEILRSIIWICRKLTLITSCNQASIAKCFVG